jgi:hypothetical protein
MKNQTDYRRNHVQKWAESGLSMQRYCSEQEISYWSFRDWKKKIEPKSSVDGCRLVEISATLYKGSRDCEPIEIILNNGIKIIVKENSGTDHLKAILCVLAEMS